MKTCTNCKTRLDDNARFCSQCGAKQIQQSVENLDKQNLTNSDKSKNPIFDELTLNEIDELYGEYADLVEKGHYLDAMELIRPFAEQAGLPTAQIFLGDCYYYDKRDYEKALHWYTKAAEQNDEIAQYKMGNMYYYGYGVYKEDFLGAVQWYVKAAKQGYTKAIDRLRELNVQWQEK